MESANGSAAPQPEPETVNPCSFREALAKEIAAENALIGNRMTWNLTFQGFLFTGYALALGRGTIVEEHQQVVPDTAAKTSAFLEALPYAGILAGCMALIGIVAAYEQMRVLQRCWKDSYETCGPKPFSDRAGDVAGAFPPFMITVIVIGTWTSLL